MTQPQPRTHAERDRLADLNRDMRELKRAHLYRLRQSDIAERQSAKWDRMAEATERKIDKLQEKIDAV